MITKVEIDREGNKVRIFHRAGVTSNERIRLEDSKYVWTHPYAEKATCVACERGIIPPEIRKGPSS